jgi:hypothetical protein
VVIESFFSLGYFDKICYIFLNLQCLGLRFLVMVVSMKHVMKTKYNWGDWGSFSSLDCLDKISCVFLNLQSLGSTDHD